MPSTTFIRMPEIMRRYSLSRTTIYRLVGQGLFPAPCKIGPRASAWSEALVDAWAKAKIGVVRDEDVA
jgi:prophage regulatory protein